MGSSTFTDDNLSKDDVIEPYVASEINTYNKNINDRILNQSKPYNNVLAEKQLNGKVPKTKTESFQNGTIRNGTIRNGDVNKIKNHNIQNGKTVNGSIGQNHVPNDKDFSLNESTPKLYINGIAPLKNGQRIIEPDQRYILSDNGFTTSDEFAEKSINCCQNKTSMIKTIIAGQVLSFMLCGTGTAATALAVNYNVQSPCFNAFLMYTLLASTFGIYAVTRKDFWKVFKKHWWKYLLVSILDVEGNYLLTKAYTYTTLTSVQLCDSFTIPTVMVISFVFLRIRYKVIHYAGVILCIAGAVSLVFLDGGDTESNAPNESVGDIIALIAAVLYGTSNVGQEYLVKKYSSARYLGIIGIFGFIISGIQTAAIEYKTVNAIEWDWQIGLMFVAFAVAQYFYYTVMPVVMKLSSATVVNLSLLTSDLYTLMVGLFLFGYKFSYMYFIAFGGIMIGLITYNIKATPTAPKKVKKKKKYKHIEDGVTVADFKTPNDLKPRVLNNHTPLLITNNNFKYTKL